jgi:hypothetical protein
VKIQNGVDVMGGTQFDDSVEMFKAGFLEDSRVHIVCKPVNAM